MRLPRLRVPYRGLFLEFALAISAVVAIAFAVNAWMTIAAGRGQLLGLVRHDLDLRAHTALQQIEGHLDRSADELDYWSRLESFDDILIHDRAMRIENLLIALQRENEELFKELSVIDRDNIVVASTEFITIGDRLPLESLNLLPESRGGLRVSDFPNHDSPSKQTLVMVHPIISRLDIEPIGWIVGKVSWQPIERLVSAPPTFGGSGKSANQFLVLLDDHGHILAMADGLLERSPSVADLLARIRSEKVVMEQFSESGEFLAAREGSRPIQGTGVARLQIVALWQKCDPWRGRHPAGRNRVDPIYRAAIAIDNDQLFGILPHRRDRFCRRKGLGVLDRRRLSLVYDPIRHPKC